MDLSQKKVTVVGAARSGIAAAKALVDSGAKVFISDIQIEPLLQKLLEKNNLLSVVDYEAGGHTDKALDSDFIVLSPGVRTDIPVLQKAKQNGIPIYSEIELAYRMSKGKRLVVTGSNGKTTTTTLLAKFCEQQFNEVFIGGNIGIPMVTFAASTTEKSVQVLEVSSFQLETIVSFAADIAIITNFFENHLDRYPDYNSYLCAKKQVTANMSSSSWLILNADQPLMREFAQTVQPQKAWFGWNLEGLQPPYITVQENKVVYTNNQGISQPLFSLDKINIIGRHNLSNVLCASIAALLAGVAPQKLASVVSEFKGVEHRLEWVRELNGINFINDSKGTNCAASITALEACSEPVILIAGGRDKGTDLTDWIEAVRKKAKHTVLYGESKVRFRSALEGYCSLKIAHSFEEAVSLAYSLASSGDVVLLSPACSSYDMFVDFVERGLRFKELVNRLGADE